MKIDQNNPKNIIVVTGPESCGKTTLAQKVAEMNDIPIVDEYARAYLESKEEGYTYDLQDLILIAKEQNRIEIETVGKRLPVVCDTDIITIQIWAKEKFNTYLDIPNPNKHQKFYILCPPDIPWTPDPLRENPEDRNRLFEVYKEYLDQHGLSYSIWNRINLEVI